jgi:hypothetical protein
LNQSPGRRFGKIGRFGVGEVVTRSRSTCVLFDKRPGHGSPFKSPAQTGPHTPAGSLLPLTGSAGSGFSPGRHSVT